MDTLTKKDLIDRVAELTRHTRNNVRDVAQTLLDLMIQELGAGKRLEFRDFGVFEIRMRKARQAQNPRTMARVSVPPRHTVKFKPGRLMRERLQKLSGRAAAEPLLTGPAGMAATWDEGERASPPAHTPPVSPAGAARIRSPRKRISAAG
ncbi:hypothetical protein BH11PLA1_BH11PLA1_13620 [soil metagenome]